MRLGVNGLRLTGRRAGVGRYIEYLIRAWSAGADPFDDVVVYVPRPLEDPITVGGPVRFQVVRPQAPPALWEHVVLPMAKPRDDLFFCPGYVVPVLSRERPRVVTHLGSYEAIPEAFPLLHRLRARLVYQTSCSRADRVITVSESSRRDIERFYGLAPEKISVVPLGVDEAFRPIDDRQRLQARRQEYFPDGRPFVLFVGKLTRRRHIPDLLEAFGRLHRQRPDLGLVLIGPDSAGQDVPGRASALGIGDAVLHRDFADHGELVEAYNACEFFIYPSEYEGFGIPVLEAMACGCIAVTLENSAFPEFAGGVAHFARDGSADGLFEAMGTVLSDAAIRRRAREEGPRRANGYRWPGIAQQVLRILGEAAGS